MANYLSKDAIVKAQDMAFEDVAVPEWGGVVRVKQFTALEKDKFESEQFTVRLVNGKPKVDTHLENKSARLAALCIVDEAGNRLFSDDEVMLLAGKSAAALQRVVKVAQQLNAISDRDVRDLADALKNDQPASLATD